MLKKNIIPIFLFILGFFSRFLLFPQMQTHTDSPSYTLALLHYNLQQETPAPPGYPLYFAFAKIVMAAAGDPYLSLLIVSAIFSGVGAVVFYLLGRAWISKTVGTIASALFLSAPTFYFFGVTAYVYLVNAVMTTIVAFLVFLILKKKKQYGAVLGVVYAVSLGVRPQEVLTTLPLFLYGVFLMKNEERVKSVMFFFITSFLWLIPFTFIVGGPSAYYEQLTRAASTALPGPDVTLAIANRFKLASGFFLTFGVGIVFFFLFFARGILIFLRTSHTRFFTNKKIIFFVMWALPSLLFNLFIRSDHAGYQTGYLTCGIFLLAILIWNLSKNKKVIPIAVAGVVCVANLVLFFYDRDPGYSLPYRQTSFHYSDLQRNDFELSLKTAFVRKHFPTDDTLLFVSSVFWRQYAYYLPGYSTIDLNGLYTSDRNVISQVRESRSWMRKEYKNDARIFEVPEGIRQIVFLDDEVCEWEVEGLILKNLEKNTCVSWLKVKSRERFKYANRVFSKKR